MATVQRPSSAIDKEEDVGMVYALIVAGGSGSRFGGPSPKQYLPLAGVPMLVRTVAVFDRCEVIDTLVLVVPAGDQQFVRESLLTAAGLRKAVLLCSGGTRRQDSVFNGLACIPHDDSLVVIHDAVRPLVTCECITACVDAARAQGAGIAAVPAWDTLKRVARSNSPGLSHRFDPHGAPCGSIAKFPGNRRRFPGGAPRGLGACRSREPPQHQDHHIRRHGVGRGVARHSVPPVRARLTIPLRLTHTAFESIFFIHLKKFAILIRPLEEGL
jgi:CTP:molybdopterin cytidylyltransferase MocA